MPEPVDVCVVGSGAGGAPVALDLARAGLSVVVLEKGPWRQLSELVHDEIGIVRRDFFVPFVADEPHLLRRGADSEGTRSNFGWIACGVGGGTVHYAGLAYRFAPDELRRRTITGGVAGASLEDWPISYEELEPWYERAERELGVSGASGGSPFEPPRRAPLPMPPLSAHPVAPLLDERWRAAGVHPHTTPKAIASQGWLGRPPCIACDSCASYGCELGAKGSTAAAILPRALETGRCEVRTGCMARELRVDEAGRARAVVYRDSAGLEHEQRARVIVVACSAVESPRLLLASRSARFPDGLANSTGLVGRNLMFLTKGGGAAHFLHEGASGLPHLGDPAPFLGRSASDHRASSGVLSFEVAGKGPIHVAEKLAAGPGARTLWGAGLKDLLRRHYREGLHLVLEAFTECLPVETNAVDVPGTVTDRHGLPVARITFAHHPADLEASRVLAGHGAALLDALSPDRRDEPASGGSYDVLQAGTCRAGDDPARSVLDRDCRAHDVPNLYVTDGSFMPTSGTVPGTLTIVANAFRVAEAIRLRAVRRELDAP